MAGKVARVLLVMALLPRAIGAQTLASTSGESSLQASIAAISKAPPPVLSMAPQPDRRARSPLSRARWIALGTGIGFGGGMVFGEYYFGRHLDLPHGPDMVMGGPIGAGVGALVAWLVTRGGSNQSPSMLPTTDRSRKRAQSISALGKAAGGSSGAITIAKPDVQSCDPL
jgi:hypothetical protein